MSNTIQIKRSSTAAAVPTAGQLAVGELAVNLVDKKLYSKDALGAVIELTPPTVTASSTAEAQAGTENTKFITPLRMREGFNASGSAPVYAARAWVNFNGTGTVAIRASGNVSSITDNGTGDYTINFTTAMPDASYSLGTSCNGDSGTSISPRNPTTTSVQIRTSGGGSGQTVLEFSTVSAQIFR